MKTLDHMREEWRLRALEWSKAHALASELSEGRKLLLDEMTLRLCSDDEKLSLAKAEKIARTSVQFRAYLRRLYDAERLAQDLKIEASNLDRAYYEQVGSEAHERASMRLHGVGR